MADVGLRSRLSWMVSGPGRLAELESEVAALRDRLDVLDAEQATRLDAIRTQVNAALDDVTARADAADGR